MGDSAGRWDQLASADGPRAEDSGPTVDQRPTPDRAPVPDTAAKPDLPRPDLKPPPDLRPPPDLAPPPDYPVLVDNGGVAPAPPFGSTVGMTAADFTVNRCDSTLFTLHDQFQKYPAVVLVYNWTSFT